MKTNQVEIGNISDYIKIVLERIEEKKETEEIVVYRGEAKDHKESACKPNIFRDKYLDNNPNFERNLFDEMSANKISNGDSYLEKAISAQHDGFPSRLLDVSYNSLMALYFACTPYYFKPEDEYDKHDGVVYLYFIKKMFCPVGNNINENYNALIKGETNCFINSVLFQKNHKLIDHIKTNKRIIAQQGAFILFQGNEPETISESKCIKIMIPQKAKKRLREELKLLFGIYTGSVYPEAGNLVKEMTEKSTMLNATEFSFATEIDLALVNLEKEMEYYLSIILSTYSTISQCTQVVKKFEEVVYSYKLGFIDLQKHYKDYGLDDTADEKIKASILTYNSFVEEYVENINRYLSGKVDVLHDDLLIYN